MRIAALYDIHGNLPALEAVLRDLENEAPDLIVIGGDVLPGPMPGDCLDLLDALPIRTLCIRGNGENDVLAASTEGTVPERVPGPHRGVIEWTAAHLEARHLESIAGWLDTASVRSDALGEILFCHATPRSDHEIITRNTPDADLADFRPDPQPDLIVCGHTHMQFDRRLDNFRIVNAGSVGMPFGDAGAFWLVLDARAQLRHTGYDLDDACDRIRQTPYPGAAGFAAGILEPPSAASMLTAFDRAARARRP